MGRTHTNKTLTVKFRSHGGTSYLMKLSNLLSLHGRSVRRENKEQIEEELMLDSFNTADLNAAHSLRSILI